MVKIRQLIGKDARQYHALCQDARKRPGFFYEASPDEVPERWLDGLVADPNYFVLGAFTAGDELVGLASISRRTHPRWRHRASIHQVYAAGDSGDVLTSLLNAAVATAEDLDGLRQLDLEVIRGDTVLLGIAERAGFDHCGDYPEAVQLDGRYYDQHLMTRRLDHAGPAV
jgi:L-amino acid N-acyltransferase YncA